MAVFTDDLFNVFEEEQEKVSAGAKKRRRDGNDSSGPAHDEQKKAKVEEAKPSLVSPSALQSSVSAAPSQLSKIVEDEPFAEDADNKEM